MGLICRAVVFALRQQATPPAYSAGKHTQVSLLKRHDREVPAVVLVDDSIRMHAHDKVVAAVTSRLEGCHVAGMEHVKGTWRQTVL